MVKNKEGPPSGLPRSEPLGERVMGMNTPLYSGRTVASFRHRHNGSGFSVCVRLWTAFTLALLLDLGVAAEQLRVGPIATDQRGGVSVAVRIPSHFSPKASDFRLLEDGEATTTAYDVKRQRTAIVVAVDVSGTMARGPLQDTKDALVSFMDVVDAGIPIALMTFGTQVSVASEFEDSREHLKEAVSSLTPEGPRSETRLYDAVYQAVDHLGDDALTKHRRILVISDGKDEGSSESLDTVVHRARNAWIPIDAVGRGRVEPQFVDALEGLVTGTGGYFAHARPGGPSLTDALRSIYDEVTNRQSLVAHFRQTAPDGANPTQIVGVALERGDEKPLSGSIPAQISHSGQGWPAWLKWALVGALALVVVALARFVMGKSLIHQKEREEKSPKASATFQVDSHTVDVPPNDVAPKSTAATSAGRMPDGRTPARRTEVGNYFPAPGPGKPCAILLGMSGVVQGRQYPVEKQHVRIGADAKNDLVIEDDDYVSAIHAHLRFERGSLLLIDEGSRNGTFLNNRKLTDVAMVVDSGDEIRVGDSTFQVLRSSVQQGAQEIGKATNRSEAPAEPHVR